MSNRHPGRWEPGDEVWYGSDGQKVYRSPDDAPVTSWVQIVGGMAPETPQDAPGRPQPVPVDVGKLLPIRCPCR